MGDALSHNCFFFISDDHFDQEDSYSGELENDSEQDGKGWENVVRRVQPAHHPADVALLAGKKADSLEGEPDVGDEVEEPVHLSVHDGLAECSVEHIETALLHRIFKSLVLYPH